MERFIQYPLNAWYYHIRTGTMENVKVLSYDCCGANAVKIAGTHVAPIEQGDLILFRQGTFPLAFMVCPQMIHTRNIGSKDDCISTGKVWMTTLDGNKYAFVKPLPW